MVGGQAVNLWAMTLLHPDDPKLSGIGSGDLDIVFEDGVQQLLASIKDQGWQVVKRSLWAMDIRTARATSTANDGRPLLVEVLSKVNGLDAYDLKNVVEIEYNGVVYRLLDPIAMLKAKLENIKTLKQDDDPPRNDRLHLQLISACVPEYISTLIKDAELLTTDHQTAIKTASDSLNRLIDILTNKRYVPLLQNEGIAPRLLVPDSARNCKLDKIRKIMIYQFPRICEDITVHNSDMLPVLEPDKLTTSTITPTKTPPSARR